MLLRGSGRSASRRARLLRGFSPCSFARRALHRLRASVEAEEAVPRSSRQGEPGGTVLAVCGPVEGGHSRGHSLKRLFESLSEWMRQGHHLSSNKHPLGTVGCDSHPGGTVLGGWHRVHH